MTLASDAMKGFAESEASINSAEKSPTVSKKSPKTPKGNIAEAEALRNFIEANKLGVSDGNRKFVKVEAYQFIANMKGLIPTFSMVDGVGENGYYCKATCYLKRDNVEVSRSTMMAEKGETFLCDKDKFAVMGTAQTRALARAVKNIYGYMLAAIGYQATPLEEIDNLTGTN